MVQRFYKILHFNYFFNLRGISFCRFFEAENKKRGEMFSPPFDFIRLLPGYPEFDFGSFAAENLSGGNLPFTRRSVAGKSEYRSSGCVFD